MNERRKPKVKIGRRNSDIPIIVLEQFKDEMKDHVAETIRITVNGKIDDLKKTTLTKEDFNKYVDMDTARWAEAKPALDNMKNLTTTGKLIVSLSVGITAVGGAYLLLKKLFNI